MMKLEKIEIKILEHCNLNCRGCFVFSNISPQEYYPLDELKDDLVRLSELFDSIKEVRVLGGEPLLVLNLLDYFDLIRQYLNGAKITIVTNGILLDTMPDRFFEYLSENKIRLSISYYIGKTMDKVKDGIQRVIQHDIKYFVFPTKYFAIEHAPKEKESVEKVFYSCKLRNRPITLYRGRIYACPKPFSIRHYDEKYVTSYEEKEDGIDLNQEGLTSEDILRALEQPMKICSLCSINPEYMRWQTGQPNEADWFKAEENELVIKGFEWYDALTYNQSLNYKVIEVDLDTKMLELRSVKETKLEETLRGKSYVWCYDENSIQIYHKLLMKTCSKKNINLQGIINTGDYINQYFDKNQVVQCDELKGKFDVFVLVSDYHELMRAIKEIRKQLIR